LQQGNGFAVKINEEKIRMAKFKTEKVVKRTIRGMLPNYRWGRGREAWKKIRCYDKIPKELDGKKFIELEKENKIKTNKIGELTK